MSNENRELLVRAHIPSTEDASKVVMDEAGEIPSRSAELETSAEHVLHEIGKLVTGNIVTINEQIDRRNIHTSAGTRNVADIRTDPVNPTTTLLAKGYKWGYTS